MNKYYERYLSIDDPEYIEFFNNIRNENIVHYKEEKEKYREALGNYEIFIDEVVDLLEWLGYSSSLELGNMIAYLIENGYLSIDCEKRRISISKEISHRLGTTIVCGDGVCRNNAGMVDDIFKRMKLTGDILFCHFNDCIEPTDGETNHAINLVYHEGIPYGIDTYNNCNLYKFDTIYTLKDIDSNVKSNLFYKACYEFSYGERTREQVIEKLEYIRALIGKDSISFQEYQKIKADVIAKMEANKDGLIYFHRDQYFAKKYIFGSIRRP